jgi:hypothetical protein
MHRRPSSTYTMDIIKHKNYTFVLLHANQKYLVHTMVLPFGDSYPIEQRRLFELKR